MDALLNRLSKNQGHYMKSAEAQNEHKLEGVIKQ